MLQPAELSLEEDISLKMKRRAFAGYGIEYHKVNNIKYLYIFEALVMKLYILNSHDVFPYSAWQKFCIKVPGNFLNDISC